MERFRGHMLRNDLQELQVEGSRCVGGVDQVAYVEEIPDGVLRAQGTVTPDGRLFLAGLNVEPGQVYDLILVPKGGGQVVQLPRFYEIIAGGGMNVVIGVVDEKGLLPTAREDHVMAFGEISKLEYENYRTMPWLKPVSKKRFVPHVNQRTWLELEEVEL